MISARPPSTTKSVSCSCSSASRLGRFRTQQFAGVSLTDAAKQIADAFDPVTQSTASGCTPKGMPILMGQPFPIEFVDRGDTILLRLEEYDAVRTIFMPGAAPRAPQQPSLLGRSLGRWESGALVVDTDLLDSPYFNSRGVPLSKAHVRSSAFGSPKTVGA
jgi:hypothetical protein